MKHLLTMILLLASSTTFAASGTEGGNGGDICEARIKNIRDDIQSWIARGGALRLSLPKEASANQYAQRMNAAFDSARISCDDSALSVDGNAKTCKNFRDDKGKIQIICNLKRFSETSESDQYVLIHHEFAGIAGLEVNGKDGSQYSISNQLSGFLENQVVKKLAIKATASYRPASDAFVEIPWPKSQPIFQELAKQLGMIDQMNCHGSDGKTSTLEGWFLAGNFDAEQYHSSLYRRQDGTPVLKTRFSIIHSSKDSYALFTLDQSQKRIVSLEFIQHVIERGPMINVGTTIEPDYQQGPGKDYWVTTMCTVSSRR